MNWSAELKARVSHQHTGDAENFKGIFTKVSSNDFEVDFFLNFFFGVENTNY